ncbi:hypothetical protein HWV62_39227 [Athelia sp. TMB]|nr:hypothetical protein HWV62_39227 [Athelia sp. TMB]
MEELSLQDLQRAATSHLRLLPHLKRCSSNGYIPRVATRIIDNYEPAREAFESCLLVPGGRFSLTRTKDSLQLWDLGNSAHSIIRSTPVASQKVGEQDIGEPVRCEMIGLHQTTDGMGLIVHLAVDPLEGHRDYRRYDHYVIYPLETCPEFCLLASACIESQADNETMTTAQELAIFTESNFVVIWNYVSDTWIQWQSDMTVSYGETYICNSYLIVAADGAISVFAMPPLQPRIQNEPVPIITHKPMYQLMHRKNVDDSYIVSDPWCDRTPPDAISNYIDIIHNTNTSGWVLDHYVLCPIKMTGSSAKLPTAFPIHEHEAHTSDEEVSDHVQMAWITPRDAVILFGAGNSLTIQLLTLPETEGGAVTQYPSCRMWTAGDDNEYCFDFCSFAGRACIRDETRPCEIRVIDYVP